MTTNSFWARYRGIILVMILSVGVAGGLIIAWQHSLQGMAPKLASHENPTPMPTPTASATAEGTPKPVGPLLQIKAFYTAYIQALDAAGRQRVLLQYATPELVARLAQISGYDGVTCSPSLPSNFTYEQNSAGPIHATVTVHETFASSAAVSPVVQVRLDDDLISDIGCP